MSWRQLGDGGAEKWPGTSSKHQMGKAFNIQELNRRWLHINRQKNNRLLCHHPYHKLLHSKVTSTVPSRFGHTDWANERQRCRETVATQRDGKDGCSWFLAEYRSESQTNLCLTDQQQQFASYSVCKPSLIPEPFILHVPRVWSLAGQKK